MGLPFVLVLGMGCVAGLMRHRTQDEMYYLCNIIAIICFLLILILAPGWVRGIVVLGITGEQLLSRTRSDGFQYRDIDRTADAPLELDLASQLPPPSAVEPQLQYRGVIYNLNSHSTSD
jgi:hypothetical protein